MQLKTMKYDVQNQTEWILFRRKHNLDKKERIFICKGYTSFKKALLERGWIENTDYNSHVFHLKFTVKRDHIFRPSRVRNAKAIQEYAATTSKATDVDYNKLHDF